MSNSQKKEKKNEAPRRYLLCRRVQKWIYDAIDGNLDGSNYRIFLYHIAKCSYCRNKLKKEYSYLRFIRKALRARFIALTADTQKIAKSLWAKLSRQV